MPSTEWAFVLRSSDTLSPSEKEEAISLFESRGWSLSHLVKFSRIHLKKLGISSDQARIIETVARDWSVLLATSTFMSHSDKAFVVAKLQASPFSFEMVRQMEWMQLQQFTGYNYTLTMQLKASLDYGFYTSPAATHWQNEDQGSESPIQPSNGPPFDASPSVPFQSFTGTTAASLSRRRRVSDDDENHGIVHEPNGGGGQVSGQGDPDDDHPISFFVDTKNALDFLCASPGTPSPLQCTTAADYGFRRPRLSSSSMPSGTTGTNVPVFSPNSKLYSPMEAMEPSSLQKQSVPSANKQNGPPTNKQKAPSRKMRKRQKPASLQKQIVPWTKKPNSQGQPFFSQLLGNIVSKATKLDSNQKADILRNPCPHSRYLGAAIDMYLDNVIFTMRRPSTNGVRPGCALLPMSLLEQIKCPGNLSKALAVAIIQEIVNDVVPCSLRKYNEMSAWYRGFFPTDSFDHSSQSQIVTNLCHIIGYNDQCQPKHPMSCFWTLLIDLFACFLFRDKAVDDAVADKRGLLFCFSPIS